MSRKTYLLFFLLFINLSLFAAQVVVSEAPENNEPFTLSDEQNTTVVADAPEEDLTAQIFYNNSPLAAEAVISQDNNNNNLLLSESWELTPFSIRITGSQLQNYGLNINLEVGLFQLLDTNGNIAQGADSYIIDSQAMRIENLSNIPGTIFNNTPLGSNSYYYSIPLSNNIYYSSDIIADFKLTWTGRDITQPGNYISNIQVTFSIN